MTSMNGAAYATLAVLSALLTAFAVQLGAGKVPIPDDWQWVVPILSAGLVAVTSLLPRIGSEPISSQVDALRERGYQRKDLRVIPQPGARPDKPTEG